jgi:maleylpyruvate isomerase
VPVPSRDIEGLVDAHARLLATLDGLSDEQARQPSRLPGWTIGHLVTHLARNADCVTRRLAGAARGVVVDQYPGGPDGRAREIDEGASRPAAELVADLRESQARLEDQARALPDEAWERPTRNVEGVEQPAWQLPFARWREAEIHHVDLGLGYEPAEWPDALVTAFLPSVLATLPERCEPHALLAWALGRGEPPELAPWG